MRKLNIYIPSAGSTLARHLLAKGSAIVADSTGCNHEVRTPQGDTIERFHKVYYEGNLYGAENLCRFEDRAMCAAGRLVTRYPTLAVGRFCDSELMLVGQMETDDQGRMLSISIPEKHASAIAAWCE